MKTVKRCAQAGFTLIEVLVTLFIVVIGLLGIAGLQAHAHVAELESYQRAQALVLLYDMVDRMNNNRVTAPCFAITTDTTNGTPYLGDSAGGGHASAPACGADSPANNALANAAINAWDGLLQGAAETKGVAATSVGAMVGARGCISYNTATEFLDTTGANIAGTGEYTVSVAWQGKANTFTPTVACGKGLYNASGGSDSIRRTVWVTLRLGTLRAR